MFVSSVHANEPCELVIVLVSKANLKSGCNNNKCDLIVRHKWRPNRDEL